MRFSFRVSAYEVEKEAGEEAGKERTLTFVWQFSLTLWAPTVVARRKWVENITAQQDAMRERSMVFDTFMLSEEVFVGDAKVNCAVPYGESHVFFEAQPKAGMQC